MYSPAAGRIQQHFAASPTHKTGDYRRTLIELWIREVWHLGTSLRNSQESVLQKPRRVFFTGPLIRQLFRDVEFDRIPIGNEKRAWNDFGLATTKCLGNNKTGNYKELVENLLLSYQQLGCNMSLKMQFLLSHLDCLFRKTVGY